MKGVFSQTKQLLKESWNLLKSDKRLLLIPIIPVVFVIVLTLIFLGIGFSFGSQSLMSKNLGLVIFIFSIGALLLLFILGLFFDVVLFVCVRDKFQGREISLKKGFSIAAKNFGKVIGWATISTGVHTAFSEASKGVATKLTAEAGRAAWKIMTTFVVPVMIFEGKGVTEAVGRSVYLFTKSWGPTVIGRFSIGLIFFVKVLIAAGIGFGLSFLYLEVLPLQTLIPIAILWGVLIAYIIISGIVISVLGGIFNVALYHYASTGQIPAGFNEETIKNAYSLEA